MNQTYVIQDQQVVIATAKTTTNNVIFDNTVCKSQQPQQTEQSSSSSSNDVRTQFKLKLNTIRKRTKLLLKKHNWKKYFYISEDEEEESDSEVEMEANENIGKNEKQIDCLFRHELMSRYQDSDEEYDLCRNQINQIDMNMNENNKNTNNNSLYLIDIAKNESKLVIKTPKTLQEQKSNNMEFYETPSSINKRKRKFVNVSDRCLRKRPNYSLLYDETRNDQESTSFVQIKLPQTPPKSTVCTPIIHLRKQQSITFIAELASTSTPTRNYEQQITSTPTMPSHNPQKYHPSRTIRKKTKQLAKIKKQQEKQIQKSNKKESHKQQQSVATPNHRNQRHHHQRHHSHKAQQQQQQAAQHHYYYYYHNYCYQCDLLSHPQVDCACMQKRANQEELYAKQQQQPCCECCCSECLESQNKYYKGQTTNKKIKFKSSNVELSLQDLLYTPSKINNLLQEKSARTGTTNTVSSAKIYYL